MTSHIYFDYASTTPVDPEVVRAMEPYFLRQFGNPSSPHSLGREAGKALEESRETLACFIGAKASEIVFCSGATEANNHAILGTAQKFKGKEGHIIVSPVEHHAVLEPVRYLEKQGFEVTYLKVDQEGLVDPDDVRKAIQDTTTLICVMHANNEIGVIQPIAEIGRIAREHQIPFLVDAVQTIGHLPVQVNDLQADFLSLSAHKFYGPKGIGALYIRGGLNIPSLLYGGDQERGRRASTPNIPGAVGLAKATELCAGRMQQEAEQQIVWRDRLLEEIPRMIEGVRVNGHCQQRLANNAHFSFERVAVESLLMSLDMAGICASMGSACASGAMEPSHVLKAIGVPETYLHGSLRLSLGRWTTAQEIECLLEKLPPIIASLRV